MEGKLPLAMAIPMGEDGLREMIQEVRAPDQAEEYLLTRLQERMRADGYPEEVVREITREDLIRFQARRNAKEVAEDYEYEGTVPKAVFFVLREVS